MALTPVTEEEFIKIMAEEGVPLSLAVGFYGVESNFGRNAAAFEAPTRRSKITNPLSGQLNAAPEKIGYGSMQVIEDTFNIHFPEVDYLKATDEQLTRAAARELKKAVNEDGTYDLDKAKRIYFGSGVDKAFEGKEGYKPSTDSALGARLSGYITNFNNGWGVNSSIADAAQTGTGALFGSPDSEEKSIAQRTADAFRSIGDRLQAIDPVAAEQKRQQAQDLSIQEQEKILSNQIAIQERILNDFATNPAGVYDEITETSQALRQANSRLRNTTRDLNYENDYGDGVGGAILAGLARFGARMNYKSQVEQVQNLSKSMQDYNSIIAGFQENAMRGTRTLSQYQSIQQEARAAASSSIETDLNTAKLAQDLARIESGLVRQQASVELQQTRNEISQARLEAQQSRARLRALKDFGTESIDALNDAAETVVKTQDPSAEYTPMADLDTWEKVYGKDKKFKQAVAEQLSRGYFNDGTEFGTVLTLAQNNPSDPILSQMAGKASQQYETTSQGILDNYAIGQGYQSWRAMLEANAYKEEAKKYPEIERQVRQGVQASIGNSPTVENAFQSVNSNPLNYKPFGMFIEAQKDSKLAKFLADNNIMANQLTSDVQLFGSLQIQMESAGLTEEMGDVFELLSEFYQDLAKQRASNPRNKQLRLTADPNQYIIIDSAGKTYDLTKRETGVQRYWTAVKKAREARKARDKYIPSPSPFGLWR